MDKKRGAEEAAAQAEADRAAISDAAQRERDSMRGDKTFLIVIIGLSVVVITGMVVYIWKRR